MSVNPLKIARAAQAKAEAGENIIRLELKKVEAERDRLLAKRHCACETAGEHDEEVVVWCKYHAAIRDECDRLNRKIDTLLAILCSIRNRAGASVMANEALEDKT